MNTNEVGPTTNAVPSQTSEATGNGRDVYPPSAAPEATKARPTVSPRKLAANRRNAQKSTGPLTLRGKEAARMNAVRHGILSSAVVVRGVRIREQEEEFKALREQCWECLAPVGRMEEALVDKIVTAQWRMRRALIAETGEIAKSVDGGLRVRGNVAPRMYGTLMDPIRDSSFALEESTEGLDFLEGILRRVREGLAKDGELTQEMCEWVEKRFGSANAMTRALWEYWTTFRGQMKAVAPEAVAEKEEIKLRHQTAVERYIELKLMEYEELRRKCLEREDKKETAAQAADVLPSSQVLEKIMRYEAALERQMYRALNQLERLQRRRGGEKLAAPLMMDVMK